MDPDENSVGGFFGGIGRRALEFRCLPPSRERMDDCSHRAHFLVRPYSPPWLSAATHQASCRTPTCVSAAWPEQEIQKHPIKTAFLPFSPPPFDDD